MPEVKLSDGYSFGKTLWKAFRPALIASVAAAGAALVQNVDVSTLTSVGVPSLLAVVVLEGLRNWYKNRGV